MKQITFKHQPDINFLQELASGRALIQKATLLSVMRMWVAYNWIYADENQLDFGHDFTNESFRHSLFEVEENTNSIHKSNVYNERDIQSCKNANCACKMTLSDWIQFSEINIELWKAEMIDGYLISEEKMNQILEERIFQCSSKTFNGILNKLVELKKLDNNLNNKKYKRQFQSDKINLSIKDNETLRDWSRLLQLGQIAFLDPRLEPILMEFENSLTQPVTPRIFIHTDYILTDEARDRVDDLQIFLQDNIWKSEEINPIFFTYNSVYYGSKSECIVYPVCIYFVQRAKYLCAYGRRPSGDIHWYNYRLDRIAYQPKILEWNDSRIPEDLVQKKLNHKLPSFNDIHTEMKRAWGFDFYFPAKLMILRFEKAFHNQYIKDTIRHDTFSLISYEETKQMVIQESQNLQERKSLLGILESRSPNDAYYTAYFRETDNNLIMRLRAWGSKVEVLFPLSLRQRMQEDAQTLWDIYQ